MRNGMRYHGGGDDHRQESHFLEACFLCRRPLGFNRDIFMYKGNTPFCSKECRQEQIEMDEAQEKSWRMSSSYAADKTTASGKKNVRTDTVAVA
ncbi:uncharacterized protein LOC111778993 [Cucurbita pepo subsp. pepo]|uniref:uncharacterized protein LOC111778993 n=1 Tax=Cucurbita pepo subsp. pepo TaxID=3664 RepID=UPI000C9D8EC3|nr:uncharacterized protein LOC111778993 [Cucurbita pepo subsp. pepo]